MNNVATFPGKYRFEPIAPGLSNTLLDVIDVIDLMVARNGCGVTMDSVREFIDAKLDERHACQPFSSNPFWRSSRMEGLDFCPEFAHYDLLGRAVLGSIIRLPTYNDRRCYSLLKELRIDLFGIPQTSKLIA